MLFQKFMILTPATKLCLVAAGVFFLLALLTGVWKYLHIVRSEKAVAPVYVDLAHRAALLYSFACILLAQFAALSTFSKEVNFAAALLPIVFFAAAIGGYVIHGALRDTDNQFLKPYRIGTRPLSGSLLHGFMWALIVGEIGGFAVLFAGFLKGL